MNVGIIVAVAVGAIIVLFPVGVVEPPMQLDEAKVKLFDHEADQIISEGKNEDVVFYFDKLYNKEKLECIQRFA
ncbi:MAG: hypothetical protein PUA75_11090 [Clostridiales bacterium]|nr:hypothetical protein [Clostridiales bacterium]